MSEELPLLLDYHVPSIRYTVFRKVEPRKGEIIKAGGCPGEEILNMIDDRATQDVMISGDDDKIDDTLQYVVDGQILLRPRLGFSDVDLVADDNDMLTLQIPVGSRVIVEGVGEEVCQDGTFHFTAEIPDTYRVRITDAWPYHDETFEIRAHEANSQS